MSTAKAVTTTGIQVPHADELELPDDWDEAQELHKYRRLVGKLQWLVNIRPAIAFAVKNLARETSRLTPDSWKKGQAFTSILGGHPRTAPAGCSKHFTCDTAELHVFSDSDWAGDVNTRKSTSGFVIQLYGTTVTFGSNPRQRLLFQAVRLSFMQWELQRQRHCFSRI